MKKVEFYQPAKISFQDEDEIKYFQRRKSRENLQRANPTKSKNKPGGKSSVGRAGECKPANMWAYLSKHGCIQ